MNNAMVTYRGCVNAWECDLWGHQNVEFYLAKAADAQAVLCCELGLTPSYLRSSGTAMLQVHDRVMFKRELRAGDALCIRSGVREVGPATLRFYSVLSNEETGAESAVFETEARLTDIATGAPVKLPPHFAARAAQLINAETAYPLPAPREGARAPTSTPKQNVLTHRGAVQSWECDESGWTPPRFHIPRFSGAAAQMMEHLGLPKAEMLSRKIGFAALESGFDYRVPLRPGQTVEIRSGVVEVGRKVLRLFHHVIAEGEVAVVMELVIVFFDLSARKSIPMPPEIAAGAHALMGSAAAAESSLG